MKVRVKVHVEGETRRQAVEPMPFDAETLLEAARTDPAELRRRFEAAAANWRRYVSESERRDGAR